MDFVTLLHQVEYNREKLKERKESGRRLRKDLESDGHQEGWERL